MSEAQPRSYTTSEPWKNAFRRTIIADSHLEITGKPAKHRARGARQIDADLSIGKENEMNFLKFRRLIITRNGYMGLAPK
jgi:hypothetical protein